MDAATSPDRVLIVIVAGLCGAALLIVIFLLGERRERLRAEAALKIRESEHAFQRGLMLLHCDAIRAESVARIKAEEARLFERRGSIG